MVLSDCERRQIAYFSMEVGLRSDMPTYAGGLGILAGDTIRAAADLHIPLVAVSLVHRSGYFSQAIDRTGWQSETPLRWPVEQVLTDTQVRTEVPIAGRKVVVRVWRYDVIHSGYCIPVLLLDTDLPENSPGDRALTDSLYGGDDRYRLSQEAILGIGGVRALRALGWGPIERFHMNEGHSALLIVELLRERAAAKGANPVSAEDLTEVRRQCVFTTHTPVRAGHDQFELSLVDDLLRDGLIHCLGGGLLHAGKLNMTYLGLIGSQFVNGVAKRHGEISRQMFAEYKIDSITNGVHPATWVSEPFARLFDQHIAGWREDNFSLRYALRVPDDQVWQAHQEAKSRLISWANQKVGAALRDDRFTLGFARRATAYKRPELLFTDLARLRQIGREAGPLQILLAGKAHPRDEEGKRLIQRVIRYAADLAGEIEVVYLPDYDMAAAARMVAGVDVWLNTPQPPLEASGTSGMKAAMNGVPSLSIADGWWLEGCIEGVTGWEIEDGLRAIAPQHDALSLYDKLEHAILPMYYHNRPRFIEVMRHAIALNGAFFHTQRMLLQYAQKAYL